MSTTVQATDEKAIDEAVLARYQQAWRDGDVDTIVELMTPDGLYEASFGPEPWGQRFVGRDAIHAAVTAQRAGVENPPSHDYIETHVFGNHGFARWVNRGVGPDGAPQESHGCDFYEFRDGLVAKKIAYRKELRK